MHRTELSTSEFTQGNAIRIVWNDGIADYIVTRANNVHFAINCQTRDAITRPQMNDFIRAFGGRIVAIEPMEETQAIAAELPPHDYLTGSHGVYLASCLAVCLVP